MYKPFLVFTLLALPLVSSANDSSADLAQELTNPIANLITVPIQFNLDQNQRQDRED